MFINFQQTRVSRSVQTVHTNIFANNRNLHKFATTNSNFEKKLLFRHASSYNVHVYQFLAKSGWYVDQSKTVHTNLFAKNRKLHKFATSNSNFEKKMYLDMHHHKTYMYINFQQNRINRSVITVHTNVFRKKMQVV